MRTEIVRDVRGCKRYLLHGKPLYSKALRAYLVDVRVISNIGGEESIYIHRQALPGTNIYLLHLHFSYVHNKHGLRA